MYSRATFHMNRVQTLLLPLDANECKSCLMTPVKRSPFPVAAFWIVRRDANDT